MPDFPQQFDFFRIMRDRALILQGDLSKDAIERDGTDANVMLAAGSAGCDEITGQLISVASASFLDSADGTDLDRLVFDRYGLVRKPAAASQVDVQFTTTAANPGDFTIPAGTIVQTTDGIQFTTIADTTFLAGGTGPVAVGVRSILAGLNQQAKPDTITSIITAIPGAAADLAVNNDEATFGADDEEQDPSLRDRARRFFVTARRGTIAALEAGALAFPGVRTAKVFETLDQDANPSRFVNMVITDAFTESLVIYDPIPTAYQAQSASLAGAVFASLDDVRAAGIFVSIKVAQIILQPVQLLLVFSAGADTNAVTTQAKAAVVNYMNGLTAGQAFEPSDCARAVRRVVGLVPTQSEVLSPQGRVVPKPLQALRSAFGMVAVA